MIGIVLALVMIVTRAANENAAVPKEEDLEKLVQEVRDALSPEGLAILESYENKVEAGTEPVQGTFRERDAYKTYLADIETSKQDWIKENTQEVTMNVRHELMRCAYVNFPENHKEALNSFRDRVLAATSLITLTSEESTATRLFDEAYLLSVGEWAAKEYVLEPCDNESYISSG